jgi:hypothetical protein
MNFNLRKSTTDIYTHQAVYDNLTQYLLNSHLYPEYHKRPEDNPTLITCSGSKPEVMINNTASISQLITPFNYRIEIISDGKALFYTGMESDLEMLWGQISPQVLFIEVTASDQWAEFARKVGHLTPVLLKSELIRFREIKGYLPEVVAVHINPANENEIRSELAEVAAFLGAKIKLGFEAMEVEVT